MIHSCDCYPCGACGAGVVGSTKAKRTYKTISFIAATSFALGLIVGLLL